MSRKVLKINRLKIYGMCGIVGLLYRKKNSEFGSIIIDMMQRLQHRGKDGAGVAIYGGLELSKDEYVLKVEVGEFNKRDVIEDILHKKCNIEEIRLIREGKDFVIFDFKIKVPDFKKLKSLLFEIQSLKDISVLSAGRFEMIKDVGTVSFVDSIYSISRKSGTHGIGHMRFSTESGVDRYHAHPFQSFIYPDVTVVHNGQITNYWKVRNVLEAKGHTFTTDNDTECIVHYIADKLLADYKLEEALESAVRRLDGPFSFIISTRNAIGVAKDKLGLRPALVSEDGEVFAVASEEVAIEPLGLNPEYLNPGEVRVFER
jgi:glutamate synthase domain-containing protein 1